MFAAFQAMTARFGIKIAAMAERYLSKQALQSVTTYGKRAGKYAGGKVDDFMTATEDRIGTWAAGSRRPLPTYDPITRQYTTYKSPWEANTSFGRFSQRAVWNLLYPATRPRAFGSGFLRGAGRSTGLQAFNYGVDALLGIPSKLVKYPVTKKFVRTFATEFRRTRGMTGIRVNNFQNLRRAYKTASREAAASSRVGQFLGPDSTDFVLSLRRYERAGVVSGRITPFIATQYVFVDEETRERRIKKFKSTFWRDVRREGRTWVDAHTRQGHPVKGHWRRVPA